MAYRDKCWEIKSKYFKDLVGGHTDKIKAQQFINARMTNLKRDLSQEAEPIRKIEINKILKAYDIVRKQIK